MIVAAKAAGWLSLRLGQPAVLGELLGVTLLMFIAGLETDLDQMRRVGKTAVVAGAAGVIAPLVLGLAVTLR